jgi:hypothetical protein
MTLRIIWALGLFVRPFTSLVDPGDIYPPQADHTLVLLRLNMHSITQVCQVPDRLAPVGGPSDLDFSSSSDRFQTVDIAVISTANRPTIGHGPSACA